MSLLIQEVADFVSANVIGTLLAMVFRWWAFRRYVFPDENVRRQQPVPTNAEEDPNGEALTHP